MFKLKHIPIDLLASRLFPLYKLLMLSELYFCLEPLSLSALEASPETVDMLVTRDHEMKNGALSKQCFCLFVFKIIL